MDRGPHSVPLIILLLCLKVKYPTRVFLLRGNHEDPTVNEHYGFLAECRVRFGAGMGDEMWIAFNKVFAWLPLGAMIENRILVVHGGLGKQVGSVQDIMAIPRPLASVVSRPALSSFLFHLTAQHSLADMPVGQFVYDVLWSDPSDNIHQVGVHANLERGGDERMSKFGPDRVRDFCLANKVDLIIRSHQCVDAGFEYFAQGRLLTVFSATSYCGQHGNAGALIEISADLKVTPKCVRHSRLGGTVEEEMGDA